MALTQAQQVALLQAYNPVLILFPNQPLGISRPGTPKLLFGHRRGDYHPSSADVFLTESIYRPFPRSFSLLDLLFRGHGLLRFLAPLFGLAGNNGQRLGLQAILNLMRDTNPANAMRNWELDLEPLPSQDAKRAWSNYQQMVQGGLAGPVIAYGRCLESVDGVALQYLYLYLYNDFKNKHEGDWESVTVVLDPLLDPQGVGLTAHAGGHYVPWVEVQRTGLLGTRPLIYVAQGSHAGYGHYRAEGYRIDKHFDSMAPPPFMGWLVRIIRWVVGRLRWRDWVPADPVAPPPNTAADKIGERVYPTMSPLPAFAPSMPAPVGKEWLRYPGVWGSRHVRFFDAPGPEGPWAGDDAARWDNQHQWATGLPRIPPLQP